MVAPKKLDFDQAGGWVDIGWQDGTTQRLALPLVRKLCPCAVCVERRESKSDILHVITEVELETTAEFREVRAVGNYAIQIVWADGHDTGIYTYDYLRSLGEETGTM
ncbi:MAG: DUF971 domain-containing protein [bacterium]|nr:DUF971 domain-containing protein [bacterium]